MTRTAQTVNVSNVQMLVLLLLLLLVHCPRVHINDGGIRILNLFLDTTPNLSSSCLAAALTR